MTTQLRIPGMDPPRQIRPNPGRMNPAFWVQRLRVVRELTAGEEPIVRDIEFKRGLNVIWAPPHTGGGQTSLFQNGVAGHTAGKSTLCRLIRHVLGERSFAPEGIRRRIREKLSSAWVLAEVSVDDETWVLARPLGIGPRSFCIRGGAIQDATQSGHRLDYQAFLDAIGSRTVEGLAGNRFPSTDEHVRWEHLLPWLTRDQETHFSDFLDWRHASSDSDSPSLSVDERQFVVRSVLGLMSEHERVEQKRNAHLVAQKREVAQQEPLLLHQARSDHARLSKALDMDLPLPSTPLFGSQAREALESRRSELVNRQQELVASDRRDELRTALEQAVAAETNARRSLEETESRLAVERAALTQLSGSAQTSLLAALPPARDYCNVPMHVAHGHGCPIAASRPADLTAKRSERTAAEELQAQRELVKSLEAAEMQAQAALAAAQTATVAARRAFLIASTTFEEFRGNLLEQRARLQQIARLIEDAESASHQASQHAETLARLTREIEESYVRQEQLRSDQRVALGRFSSRFDYVLRAILGDPVSGRVETAGRSLSLIVEEHGERESTAIKTVKLLAFDLAAMTASIEGDGFFPRFLIHDGPREGDMAPDIYERLFLFARELEKCFPGEPAFQYIVTTTTSPPDGFQSAPWLRLLLAGVPTEERLLRCDL